MSADPFNFPPPAWLPKEDAVAAQAAAASDRWRIGEAPPIATASTRRLKLTPASDIVPRRVRWLWEGRLAIGTLGLLAGREGLGKSTLAYWLAARITRGDLPGEYKDQPRGVLVCATEDSWEHTIVPRLMAAGADLQKVFRFEVVTLEDLHVSISLPRDTANLPKAADHADAALLLLDPLMSRLGADLDTHKDQQVRQALEPLVSKADELGMSVLGLIHHNKSGSADPLQLVMGSKAFTAVARSVHSVIPDPDDDTDTRRLFGTPKNNLGRTDLPVLSFTIAGHPIDTEDGTAWTGRLEWGDELDGSIGDAMRRAADGGDDRTATGEAAGWLTDFIQMKGGTASSQEAKNEGRKAGHSEASIRRACKRLKLTVTSEGFPRKTYWSLLTVGSPLGETYQYEPTEPTEPTGVNKEINAAPANKQLAQSAQSAHDPTRVGQLSWTAAIAMGAN